jgi:hypothetical protein
MFRLFVATFVDPAAAHFVGPADFSVSAFPLPFVVTLQLCNHVTQFVACSTLDIDARHLRTLAGPRR